MRLPEVPALFTSPQLRAASSTGENLSTTPPAMKFISMAPPTRVQPGALLTHFPQARSATYTTSFTILGQLPLDLDRRLWGRMPHPSRLLRFLPRRDRPARQPASSHRGRRPHRRRPLFLFRHSSSQDPFMGRPRSRTHRTNRRARLSQTRPSEQLQDWEMIAAKRRKNAAPRRKPWVT